MKRLYKIIAVTLVTALLIFGLSLNVFAFEVYDGWFFPTDDYPTSSSLIYGPDTLVIDINYYADAPQTLYYRFQASSDSIFWVTENYANGKYNYILNICSNNPIYSYTVRRDNGYDGVTTAFSKGSSYGYEYWYYEAVSLSGVIPFDCFSTKNYQTPSNLSLGSGVSLVKNIIQVYPSATDIQNIENYDKLSNQLKENFTSIDNRLEEGFASVNQGITQAVNDILNAGSDMPTLDTDNSWMNDSLTKVNEWLSTLEEFDKQMDAAEQENSENMAQAKSFLSSFFSKIPKGIVAALTLALVMIVAVKAVGR